MAQLDHAARKALHINLNARITEAFVEIDKIKKGPQPELPKGTVIDQDGKELAEHKEHVDSFNERQEEIEKQSKETPATETETEIATAMETAIKPTPRVLTKKDQDDITYLNNRITTLQMSLRLSFNTEWIIEERKGLLQGCKTVLDEIAVTPFVKDSSATDKANHDNECLYNEKQLKQKSNTITMANDLAKAKNCKKKGCWGRGFIGWPQHKGATGEFTLCDCTIKTIHYYNVNQE